MPMKTDKAVYAELDRCIRAQGEKFGYQQSEDGFPYAIRGENLLSVLYYPTPEGTLRYQISVKKCCYDDRYWDILHMPENKAAHVSYRAKAAYSCPFVTIRQGELPVMGDSAGMAEALWTIAETASGDFLKQQDVSDYILAAEDLAYHGILKCMAYLDKQDPAAALAVARAQLACGNVGDGFSNENKGFFQWLVETLTE